MRLLIVLLFTGLIACGCSTMSSPSTATPSSAVVHSAYITAAQNAEYVALAKQYGYLFPQQIDGSETQLMPDGTYHISSGYRAKYQIMLEWKKSGAK